MNNAANNFAPLGPMSANDGYRINGSDVRFWSTKRQAIAAAKLIGWPVLSVEKVHTRFQIGWAIVDTRFGAISRDGFASLVSALGAA